VGVGDLLGRETCLYTNTPDEDFVLERHDRVVFGSPCSGHGSSSRRSSDGRSRLAREVVD
jgi:hypothetical protein